MGKSEPRKDTAKDGRQFTELSEGNYIGTDPRTGEKKIISIDSEAAARQAEALSGDDDE